MDEPLKLDLKRDKCHICGTTVQRDIENEQQWCRHFSCSAKNIKFSIPYVLEKKGATK